MTISTTDNKARYEGNGVTATFAFNKRIFSSADLVVKIILRSDDSEVETLTLTTDYSVTISGPQTASVTVVSGKIPSSLQDILIYRDIAKTQTLDLPTGTVFPAVSVENALDKVVAIVQDLQEEVDRKVGIPITDSEAAPDVIQLLQDAQSGAETAQSAAEAAQAAAESAEAGAVAAQAAAEAAAAGVDLPSLGSANQVLKVNSGGSALEYGTVSAANITANTVTNAKLAQVGTSTIKGRVTSGTGDVEDLTATQARSVISVYSQSEVDALISSAGVFVQQVYNSTSSVSTTSTAIPRDNTLPQNTEGAEVITLSITPTNASNYIVVEGRINASLSASSVGIIVALFKDSDASALAVSAFAPPSSQLLSSIPFSYRMVAGTTSTMTFKVRVGAASGTVTVNGENGLAVYGGASISVIKITEIKA